MTAIAHNRRKRDNEAKEEFIQIRKDDIPNISIWPVLLVIGCAAFVFGWMLNALVTG